MKKNLNDKEAARLEFSHEPMSAYYLHPLAGIPSRLRIKQIFKELGRISGKKLLDVGCEAGYITIQLAKRGARVTAIDLIETPIKQLKTSIKNQALKINPRVADATRMPFSDREFEIVLATEVIEHISRLNLFIREVYRVLTPGGRLLITFPNENLRKKLYPLVSLFGINASIEDQVTLKNYQSDKILQQFTAKFLLVKSYRLPWWLPITNLMLFKKPGPA